MWWRFRLKTERPDDILFELGELGAQGIESKSESEIETYFSGTEADRSKIESALRSLNVEIISIEPVEDTNWTAKCAELWTPVEIGKIRVVPLQQTSEIENSNSNELFIVPGTGFGTGHHASTALALELIQSEEIARIEPKEICDLGTGSGILAIQLAKQFPDSRIDAIDVDQLALDNAKENIRLNKKESQISLSKEPFSSNLRKFDLIVANLYAEMLCSLRSELVSHSKNGGYLIVSGILEQLWDEVKTAFCEPSSRDCTLLKSASNKEWRAGIFRIGDRDQ